VIPPNQEACALFSLRCVYVLSLPLFSFLQIQRATYKLKLQPSIISSLALFGVPHSSYFYLLTTILSRLTKLLPSWADHHRILACYIRSCVVYPITLFVCFIVAPWLWLWLVSWIPRQPTLSKQQQSPLAPDLFLFSVQYMNLIPNVQILFFPTTKTAELTPP
jgi:hypothetical protein